MTKLRTDKIRLDGGTQMRVGPRNPDALADYKNAIQEGASLPPIVVFFDGRDHWLADGFHRWSAHRELALDHIEADVREGSQRDAVLYAVGANASHGLRRSNADKRKAVETLLKDEEWGQWSSREIARRCSVHHQLVERLRREMAPHLDEHPDSPITNNVSDAPVTRTVQRGGTTYTVNTANIGQRPISSEGPRLERDPSTADSDEPADVAPPTSEPEQELLPPARLQPHQARSESEPVYQAEDLYIPFHDPEEQRKSAAEIEKGVRDIHNALDRLLRHERDGRGLLATPDPYTRSVRDLAWHAREMLDDWLDERTEKESRTITIDALN